MGVRQAALENFEHLSVREFDDKTQHMISPNHRNRGSNNVPFLNQCSNMGDFLLLGIYSRQCPLRQ